MAGSSKSRGVTCPHCEAVAVTYSSRRLSALVSEKYYACSNLACGHVFVVSIGVVRSITPSMTPNAEVNIPLVQRRANDILVDAPAPAQGESSPQPARAPHGPIEHARGDVPSSRGAH